MFAWGVPAAAEAERSSLAIKQKHQPPFSAEDELILELRIMGAERRDTIIAYGRLPEVYLPFGLISRLLDLAVTVSDDGRFASGWVLREESSVALEAGKEFFVKEEKEFGVPADSFVAFDGELYVRSELLEVILPIDVEVDIRAQSVEIQTREVFPFQSKQARDSRRNLLNSQQRNEGREEFARQQTPYQLYSVPKADLELRAVSDGPRGTRAEAEIYLAGDLAAASAELYLSGASNDGFTAALFEVGRNDPDGDLLGPLNATSFAVGDVQTSRQPIGLRSSFGRGIRLSNAPLDAQSVFDEIDLRGVLQDGFEVELYRNGILLGSTDQAVSGQYEFLQVPVDFGINIFRLVFYGPQGQQREEVRTIRVGDGRLPQGQFNYEFGIVQNEQTLFDVRPKGTIRPPNAGSWRSIGNAAYGLSPDLTLVGSVSLDQENRAGQNVVGSFGIRTGVSATGIRFDAAFSGSGGFGAVVGVNGQIGATNITVNHSEYANGFVDEQRGSTGRALARATDLNLSTSLTLGSKFFVPLIGRAKHLQYSDGGRESRASLRASTRIEGFLLSNSIELADFRTPEGSESQQIVGNFDLSSPRKGNFRARAAVDYELVPDLKPIGVGLVTDYNFREDSLLQFSTGYRLDGSSLFAGASVLTKLGRTTLALDADYDFKRESHSVALRWGMSFGKNATGFFVDESARARLGAVEVTAFHDRDADGVRDADEEVLPNLTFFSPTESAETDVSGRAMITGLPTSRPINIQIDLASLPDISLIPESDGFEIVPRRGRTHSVDFPIVSVGEVDGTVMFSSAAGEQAVGGVSLGLKPFAGQEPILWLRSEADGYFYFEQLRPGRYEIVLDEDQAERLQLCLLPGARNELEIDPDGGSQTADVRITKCSPAAQP